MTRRFFLAMALLVAAVAAEARTLTPAEAEAVAARVFAPAGMAAPASLDLRLVHTRVLCGQTCFYAFCNPAGGFAIVGGCEAAPSLLGYSDHGSFSVDKAPAALLELLNAHAHKIAAMEAADICAQPRRAPAANRMNVAKILSTEWGQDAPYNNLIPLPNGDESQCLATGCVATATAQVMKHFGYPARGLGEHTYSFDEVQLTDGSYISMTFSADFANTSYDWDHMLDTYWEYNAADATYYPVECTDQQANAVATLMYHVGVASDMQYCTPDVGGSGTMTDQMAEGLRTYFDYSCDYAAISDEPTDDEWNDWDNKVYQEIAYGNPIVYAGNDENGEGGHCFVLDGYDAANDMYHVNWGWDGTCDGFYTLYDGLAPSEQGTGGSDSGNFSYGQEMIYHIRPNHSSAVSNASAASAPSKILRDGQLLIRKDGRTFDALGRTLDALGRTLDALGRQAD